MTDKARLKESLKKVLRALLLSAPLGLTPKELENDFREVEGHELPYRKLGYNTVNDLLQDMPDVIETSWNRGELVISGKADHTTAHIKSLVSRQRVDVSKALKKRAAVARRASRPSQSYSTSGSRHGSGPPGVKPRGPRFGVRPTVPAYLQTEIKSFLMIHPNGVLNTEFEMQFGKKFGHTIPYSKMGFSSLRDLTMSMGDSVSVEMLSRGRYRIYDKSNYPVNSQFTVEKTTVTEAPKRLTAPSAPSTRRTPSSSSSTTSLHKGSNNSSMTNSKSKGFSSSSVTPDSRPQGFSARASGLPLSSKSNIEQARAGNANRQMRSLSSPARSAGPPMARPAGQSQARPTVQSQARPTGQSSARPTGQTSAKSSGQSSKTGARRHSGSDHARGAVGDSKTKEVDLSFDDGLDAEFGGEFLQEIQQVMAKNPNGIMAASLPTAYKQHTGKELPMFSLGFYSVVELVCAMPSIVTVEREESHGDWTLYDARTHKPKALAESPIRNRSMASEHQDQMVNFDELKNRIYDTLQRHPEGLLIQDLADEYQRVNNVPFPMEELGFQDVDSVVLLMQDVINIAYKGRDNVFLYPVEERPQRPPVRGHWSSLPADAVGFGPRYKPAKMPPLNEYVEVFVATVFTPHKISLQIKDPAMNDALEDLMNNLESVYCYQEGDHYEMPESLIAVSQICCALFHEDSNWHRAVITGIPNMDLVEVVYIDYGTVASVPKASLRLLKSCFMKLPIQAVDARLSSIQPAKEKWTKASQTRLLDLTMDKALICMTTEIKENVASVLLTDTSTEEDIHINDALVDEGHARFIVPVDEEAASQPQVQDNAAYSTATFDIASYLSSGDATSMQEPPPVERKEDTTLHTPDVVNVGHDGDGVPQEPHKRGGGVMPPGLPDVSPNLQDAQQLYDQDALETNSHTSDLNPTASPFRPQTSSTASETDSEIREINRELEVTSLDDQFGIHWVVKCFELANQWLVHVILGPVDDVYMLTDEVAGLLESPDNEGGGLNQLAHLIFELSESGPEIEVYNLTKIDSPGLFEELIRVGVSLSGMLAHQLTEVRLISLTNALLILGSSGNLSIEFLSQMQEMQMQLAGGSPVEEEEREQEKDDIVVSLEELLRYMKCLEINRKRCLDAMMASGGTQYVDELQEIESTISVIKEKIEEMHTANSDSTPSSNSPLSPSPMSLKSPTSPQPQVQGTKPVIDIPAGHPAPFVEESPRAKLTQVVQPIPQPQGQPQAIIQPSLSIHTSVAGPQHQRPHPVWSSGYDAVPGQPTSYTLQSSLTLQQSIPPFVAQYSIQQVPPPPPHLLSQPPPSNQGPAMMRPTPPTPPRGMAGPPPNIGLPTNIGPPPPIGIPPPPHLGLHPPSGPPPPHRLPPPIGHGSGQQQPQFIHPQQGGPPPYTQHPSGIGRGVRPWQY